MSRIFIRIDYAFVISALLGLVLMTGAAQAQIALGMYENSNGWDKASLSAFRDETKQKPAIINVYTNFDYDWDTLAPQSDNIRAQRAQVMITLEPTLASRPNDNLLPEIADGDWDRYVDKWIADMLAWLRSRDGRGTTIYLRFAHEFNGSWYPWSNDAQGYVAAWRRIHDRFEARGANAYVEWVWSANNDDYDRYRDVTRYYPGGDYVDWVALDGYNWGSNLAGRKWTSFADLFREKYKLFTREFPNKPIMIAEVACVEPHDTPNRAMGHDGDDSDRGESKEAWIRDMILALDTEFARIDAVLWFDANKEYNWSVSASPANTGASAFKQWRNGRNVLASRERRGDQTASLSPAPTGGRYASLSVGAGRAQSGIGGR